MVTAILICPNCGKDTDKLVERTGFCYDCSTERGFCPECGQPNKTDHILCRNCRRSQWLMENADRIERYQALGFDLETSFELTRRENEEKLNCLSCGGFVRDPRSLFCTRTARCKAARTKFKYLHYRKGVSRELALKTVLTALAKE